MKYYYDTEFLEDGKTIELISIGIVAEDGREYYAVNSDMPVERIHNHEWLMTSVWPHLPVVGHNTGKISFTTYPQQRSAWGELDMNSTLLRPRWLIANEVREFLLAAGEPELWAWYADYDHVALCQLWGSMTYLPAGMPMFTHDLKQECVRLGNPQMPVQEQGEHNALEDARHVKVMAEFLASLP